MAISITLGAKSFAEQTPAQVSNQIYSHSIYGFEFNAGLLDHHHHRLTFHKIREMRRDPTIRLARALSVAPLLAAPWSIDAVDGAPDGAQDFIKSEILPWRSTLLRTSLFGCFDYGWQPYEKVFEFRPAGGRIGLRKLKPLLQDLTEIIVNCDNGSFNGFRNNSELLGIANVLLLNQGVEGTNHYGESTMAACEGPYDDWNVTNAGSKKHSHKMAGAHWIIHYPPGTTPYGGIETDNYDIAKSLVAKLEANGSFVVPSTVEAFVDDLNKNVKAWTIELKETDSNANAGFNEKLSYQDVLKVRACELPERAILEGQFGTKAEAEAHADFALVNMENKGDLMLQQYNWHLVNQLLRTNWGASAENTVFIKRAPIVDATLQFLREMYKAFFILPEGIVQEKNNVNWKAIRDRLGLPQLRDTEVKMQSDDDFADVLTDIVKSLQLVGDPAVPARV